MDHFTNEYHDVAQDEAFDPGFDALHVRAPDELLMAAEEDRQEDVLTDVEDRCRCIISVLRAITWRAASLDDIRDNVAILYGEKIGWKAVPVQELWRGRDAYAGMRGRWTKLMNERRIDWHADAGRMLMERFLSRGWESREVAKMVLLLLYASLPDQRFRPAMAESLGAIGEAIGLKAANKRSAVSAAMRTNVVPLFEAISETRAGMPRRVKLWFMKQDHCREALRVAMKGKRNRAKKAGKVSGSKFQVSSSEEGRAA